MAERKPVVLVGGVLKEMPSGDALPAANIPEVTAANIHAAPSKATPVDADELGLSDSAASWGLKKLTFANLKAVLLAYFKGEFREKLTAPRTYYVRTDGSDSNSGLSNSSGGAFLTTQKAIDAASALDNGGHNITIQHGPGTHTGSAVAKTFVGSGTMILMGDLSTPANCSWVVSAGVVFSVPDGVVGEYLIQGFSIASNSNVCMAVGRGGTLKFSNLEFGASIGHIATNGGLCKAVGNYAIKGGAVYHATAAYNGSIQISGVTVTLTGTPAFSMFFARAEVASTISAYSNTFSGSATGTRYIVADNSVIFVNGAGATYLPGNAAGTNDGTGVYH